MLRNPRSRSAVLAASLVLIASAVLGSLSGAAGASATAVTAGGGQPGSPAWSMSGANLVSHLVRQGGGYPQALPETPSAGTVASSATLSLEVVLHLPDAKAVAAAAAAVDTPGSPSYHHYLAAGQFARQYGPSPATVSAVEHWLRAEGMHPGRVVDDLLVPFKTTAGVAERAFGLTEHLARLPSGRLARIPNAAPLVPATLAGAVAGIAGLDTLAQPVSHLVRASPASARAVTAARSTGGASRAHLAGAVGHEAGPTSCPAATDAAAGGGFTFAQLASAYQYTTLYDQGRLGQGVTIAAVELEPFSESDLAGFESCTGVDPSVSVVPVAGGAGFGSGSGEAALDVESLAALAPEANIVAYEAPNSDIGSDSDYATIVSQDRAQVVTTSWGQCEPEMALADLDAETAAFEQATLQGQSVVAASGDSGSEDCFIAGVNDDTALAVDDPGSQPWVTSVGGAALLGTTSSGGLDQAVWNDCQGDLSATGQPTNCAANPFDPGGAGGGGLSSLWDMPSYQSAAGLMSDLPEDSGGTCTEAGGTVGAPTGVCRAVPDVSGDADPSTGVVIEYDGQWGQVGGTSAAAPQWAALLALADSGCSLANQVGELNAKLYPLASGPDGTALLDGVTSGDNDLTGTNGGRYSAGPGYNLAAGWGTPKVAALVDALQPGGGCPVVSGLSATSGLARGGSPSSITISGANLAGASAVHFGPVRVPASSFTVGAGGTSITLTPPPGPSGVVSVTVTTANGTSGSSIASLFTYIGPAVSAISPASGPPGGGQLVTITGSGFTAPGADPSATTVAFGTTPAGDVTVVSDTTITAVAPAHAPGLVDVVVTDADGANGSGSGDQYRYLGPGYDLVASDGGVFAFGDAGFYGSTGNIALAKPIVGMAATPGGGGYWLVASDGGVFAFGDAGFYGSTGNIALAKPIVGMAATPGGGGYWLVASDGGVFAFGDAGFYGSLPGLPAADQPGKAVVGMAATPDGSGYWEVTSAGDVYNFGDAGFYGSTGNIALAKPIVGMAG